MEITRSILVCNENSDERKKIIEALIRNDYRHVDEATNGDAAIERLGKSKYDIAIIDLWVSGIDGIGIIRSARKICSGQLPALILTSPINKQTILMEATEAGADVIVAGSAIFNAKKPRAVVAEIRRMVEEHPYRR